MDSPTISALAAWAAAAVALTGVGFQFFVGRKQAAAAETASKAALTHAQNAGRHTRAEFRQEWIDKVIDALSEHNAILLSMPDNGPLPPEDVRKLAALRSRLDILLNPDEEEPIELMRLLDSIPECKTKSEQEAVAHKAVKVARKHLKAEWVRIKEELG